VQSVGAAAATELLSTTPIAKTVAKTSSFADEQTGNESTGVEWRGCARVERLTQHRHRYTRARMRGRRLPATPKKQRQQQRSFDVWPMPVRSDLHGTALQWPRFSWLSTGVCCSDAVICRDALLLQPTKRVSISIGNLCSALTVNKKTQLSLWQPTVLVVSDFQGHPKLMIFISC